MKKLFALLGFIAAFAMIPTVTMAAPPPSSQAIQHARAVNPVGNYVISFNCASCVPHNITINSYNAHTGAFTGYGTYAVNPAFTWTISGIVTGNQITMRILYTGQGAGYYVDLVGTIAANGSMSGSATDSSGATFSWLTTSGLVGSCKNHGQYVRDADDKRTAAHSDYGRHLRR